MKKQILAFLLLLGSAYSVDASFSGDFKKKDVKEVCDTVANWQIENNKDVKSNPLDWTSGALYRGMVEWSKTSGNQACLDFILKIGEDHKWNVGARPYHADDICVGQAFIELYRKTGKERMIQPVRERAFYVASHPSKAPLLQTDPIGRNERWSWSDALFMAPPVYAALYQITGEKVYLDYLDSEYKSCVDSLFDRKEKLFYRDNKRFSLREKNGARQFWGRGNGWVFAGLPLIIDNLPAETESRAYYINLFVQMAESVAKTQCKSGEWRASLLDPDSYDVPENSCSAFMCYGIAWGIRNNYLGQKQYLPILKKGWKSLIKGVHEDGKPGYIQPGGDAPGAAGYESTYIYGVGAFLMAGSEIYKLVED